MDDTSRVTPSVRDHPVYPAGGIVLAGGQSRRLGRDKARVLINGQPAVLWQVQLLQTVVSSVVVVVAPGRHYRVPVPEVPDEFPNEGPLGGIATGLRHLSTSAAFVCACDMPLLRPALIGGLFKALGDNDLAIPECNGRLQPLCAVYAARCLPVIERLYAAGERRAHAVATAVPCVRIQEEQWRQWDSAGESFVSINSETDLTMVRRLALQRDIVVDGEDHLPEGCSPLFPSPGGRGE